MALPMGTTYKIQVDCLAVVKGSNLKATPQQVLEPLFLVPGGCKCELRGCQVLHDMPSMGKLGWTAGATNHKVALTDSETAAIHNFDQHYTVDAARLTSPNFRPFPPPWWYRSIRGRWGGTADHEPYWSPNWQVRKILSRLHTINLNPGTFGIVGVLANETCRLKVGVTVDAKCDHDRGLQRFKTVLKAGVLFERLYDAAKGIKTIRRGSMNAQTWVRRIQAQRTHGQLSDLARRLSGGSSVTLSRANRSLHTAATHSVWHEFPASLELQAMLSLIEACRKLVHWADGCQRDVHHDFLMQSSLDPTYKLPAFLQSIGLGETALSYFRAPLPKDGVEQSQAAIDFHRTLQGIAPHHPLWLLLHDVALARLWDTHEVNLEMISNEKIRNGEYGWLPTGPALDLSSPQSPTHVASIASGEWLAKPRWHDTSETRHIPRDPGPHEWARRDSAILILAGKPSHRSTASLLSPTPPISFDTDLGLNEDGSIGWKMFPKRHLAMKNRSADDSDIDTGTGQFCGSQAGFASVTRRSMDRRMVTLNNSASME